MSPLSLPYISPISPLYLPCISPISRTCATESSSWSCAVALPAEDSTRCVSWLGVGVGVGLAPSPLHLPNISPVSPVYLLHAELEAREHAEGGGVRVGFGQQQRDLGEGWGPGQG